MARYKVLETSFIDNSIVHPGEIIDINDDPDNSGVTPGSNLAKADEDGELEAIKPARRRRTTAEADADLA